MKMTGDRNSSHWCLALMNDSNKILRDSKNNGVAETLPAVGVEWKARPPWGVERTEKFMPIKYFLRWKLFYFILYYIIFVKKKHF